MCMCVCMSVYLCVCVSFGLCLSLSLRSSVSLSTLRPVHRVGLLAYPNQQHKRSPTPPTETPANTYPITSIHPDSAFLLLNSISNGFVPASEAPVPFSSLPGFVSRTSRMQVRVESAQNTILVVCRKQRHLSGNDSEERNSSAYLRYLLTTKIYKA